MILILVEASYADSIWCIRLLEGLTGRLKQKRLPFRQITSLDEAGPDSRYIYLIGSDNVWLEAALQACNQAGVYPILLCNQAYHTFDADYSTVCLDVVNSMRRLMEILSARGLDRVALYGVNPQSVSDEAREEGYLSARARDGRGKSDVFFNNGSLENCFEIFLRRSGEYDAAICVNEFAAVSLARRLARRDPERAQRLLIVSCADGWLSQFYEGRILSVKGNFAARAKAAVALLENLRKNPDLSHIIMTIRWDFSALQPGTGTPAPAAPGDGYPPLPWIQDAFYEDSELNEMMLVERLLRESADTDRVLLWHLLQGESYQMISEKCFLTESAIKYRVKKMVELCRVEGRQQLVALLNEYLPQPLPGGREGLSPARRRRGGR